LELELEWFEEKRGRMKGVLLKATKASAESPAVQST
jgi:hypothetical protein